MSVQNEEEKYSTIISWFNNFSEYNTKESESLIDEWRPWLEWYPPVM